MRERELHTKMTPTVSVEVAVELKVLISFVDLEKSAPQPKQKSDSAALCTVSEVLVRACVRSFAAGCVILCHSACKKSFKLNSSRTSNMIAC